MKKLTFLVASVFLVSAQAAFAGGPYTASMTGDVYDTTPDAIPTPAQTGTPSNNVPDIKDAVNLLLGSSYAKNEDVDSLQFVGNDNTWVDFSSGSDLAGYALIGLSVISDNTLRVYDTTNPGTKIDVFDGSFTGFGLTGDGTNGSPFPYAESVFSSGTNFGWNVKRTLGADVSYLDSDAALNADTLDHMLSYRLTALSGKSVFVQYTAGPNVGDVFEYTFNDPYLIAWEVAPNGGDEDYNDLLYVVDRVTPVPEPMTMALLGSGLVGMLGLRRKKNVQFYVVNQADLG